MTAAESKNVETEIPEPAGQSQTERPQAEKPYRVGDEVYLDDGANYRIERIEPDSVTLRALGLDSRFVVAFRDLYIDDFEKQIRGNVFNQDIFNRAAKPRVSESAEAGGAAKPEEMTVYPEAIGHSPILRAFYDAFGQDERLSNDLREAILNATQPGFKENIVKQRRIKAAIFNVLQAHDAENPAEDTERAFGIFLGQSENETQAHVSERVAPDAISDAAAPETRQGQRKRAYPTVSLPQLKSWLSEKPEGADLAALEMEITLREKEIEYIDAGVGEERKRIRAEITELTGGYAPSLPTPQISPDHDAEGMPITSKRREAQARETSDRLEPESVTIIGTELGPNGRTIEITLPSEAEIIARHEAERESASVDETHREPEKDIHPKIDFRIADDNLGHGGQKTKCRNNVEAIKTLRKHRGRWEACNLRRAGGLVEVR